MFQKPNMMHRSEFVNNIPSEPRSEVIITQLEITIISLDMDLTSSLSIFKLPTPWQFDAFFFTDFLEGIR